MKDIFQKLFILFVITSLSIPTTFASFEDVLEGHQNYEAINYLQENNIIQGYEDNTFKPAIKINRVEFLKIILEGSSIELNNTENLPFKDKSFDYVISVTAVHNFKDIKKAMIVDTSKD